MRTRCQTIGAAFFGQLNLRLYLVHTAGVNAPNQRHLPLSAAATPPCRRVCGNWGVELTMSILQRKPFPARVCFCCYSTNSKGKLYIMNYLCVGDLKTEPAIFGALRTRNPTNCFGVLARCVVIAASWRLWKAKKPTALKRHLQMRLARRARSSLASPRSCQGEVCAMTISMGPVRP